MTPYTPTTWVDEIPVSSPVKYKITDDTGGVIANSAKIETVTEITAGTAVNAANLNKLESGVAAAGRFTFGQDGDGWSKTGWNLGAVHPAGDYVFFANDFNPAIPNTAKSLSFNVSAKWDVSSTSGIYVVLKPYADPENTIECLQIRSLNIATGAWDDRNGIVPLSSDGRFRIKIVGAPAYIYLRVWGWFGG